MRVLLVADEPQAAWVLAKGEQTYAVEVAADGDAAIFEAGTTDYDAIVLDVILPRQERQGLVVVQTWSSGPLAGCGLTSAGASFSVSLGVSTGCCAPAEDGAHVKPG
jgi:CheY-like chemotaxis protein